MSVTTARRRLLMKNFGLSADDFERLLEEQDHRCPICMKRFTKTRPPCVDHDHRTGEIWGLLCPRDNWSLLGTFGRVLDYWCRVVEYLSDPPARIALGGPRYVPDAPPQDEEAPPHPD